MKKLEWHFDETQKMEVYEDKYGFTVQFFEKMGDRWVELGTPDRWMNFQDICDCYEIA